MPLTPGTRLGHYDVTANLGEGGMGEVWQATDTQLNLQVALKILPDAFAADPDRLARFTRETQILARARAGPDDLASDDDARDQNRRNQTRLTLAAERPAAQSPSQRPPPRRRR